MASKTQRPCSIAGTLGVIGEKYSVLVLREVFLGVRRFDAIARNVGAPRDVLAARLRRLVERGVLERVLYQDRPERYEYRLTQAGRELRPVLLTLMAWGDKHLGHEPPVIFEHDCGNDLLPVTVCAHCRAEVAEGSLRARHADPAWAAG
ncbi:helix-turn-helix domain-containing protein [Streptomyces sp. DSM 44917]|uniref:Helix-turn-helix domain-containing protein n=1 Tax=Streptomyces boetiae TaxID=3075541 RepID=A0ABU2L507_9ACTN|nr:helix-turn-helix domain-containing protein [Streptomyces sp. DSM 44917]MDT0306639.1 helix-turn-helix domain-containing protein [Streptomyces sp. DSM 44917]